MTRVMVTQHNDGIQSGDEFEVFPAFPDDTAQGLLVRKAASHQAHGWTVAWDDATGFHAWKQYPGRPVERKDRYFRLSDT